MLKRLLILALLAISNKVYAQLDTEFLSNELYKITNHNLKNNIYTFHLAANNFKNMKPSEYDINLKNVDKLLNNRKVKNNFTEEELDFIKGNYEQVIKEIYQTTNPEINKAMTFNFKVNDSFFTMISIPNIYYENYKNCEGPFILFDSYICFEMDNSTKEFLSKYIKNNYVKSLDSEYMGHFTVIHEYAHVLPEQLKLNPTEIFKNIHNPEVKKNMNLLYHFNEIYSDLYAGIRLLQKGYSPEYLEQVIFMRNISLFLYQDTVHFSSPYIKYLKNLDPENYMEITSFKEFDNIIKKIFFQVINEVDTTNHKNFYVEKLEARQQLNHMSQFIIELNNNIGDNTFKKKTKEEIDFITNLFNAFLRNIYYSNGRMRLES
jgi:hypothetical protein